MSIKKKLVTAVTTAGLLAGLFGSAFVPVAHAAATATVGFVDVAVVAANAGFPTANEDYNDTTGKIAYYSAAVYPVVVFAIDFAVDAADDGTYEVAVAGGTIRGCQADATDDGNDAGDASTATFSANLVISSTTCSVSVTSSIAADDLYVALTLNKLAADASATFTVTDPDGDSLTIAAANKATGVASTGLVSVINATKSLASVKVNFDGDATTAEAVDDVADEVISSVNYFLPVAAGSDPVYVGTVANGYGTAAGGGVATPLIAEVTSPYLVGCDTAAGTAPTSSGASIQTFNSSAAGVWECEVIEDSAASTGGAWTLTVKSVAGTVLGTASGAYYGEVASITATSQLAGGRIPTVAGADIDDAVLLVVKDVKGAQYGLAETDAQTIVSKQTVAGATATSAGTLVDGTAAATKNYFKLDDALCPVSSDGKTATVQASITNATTTVILSNTLTVTCGANAADALVIDRIEYSKANPVPGEALSAYVYMEDADGNLAGSGDIAADFSLSLTNATSTSVEWNGTLVDATNTLGAGATQTVAIKVDSYGRITLGIKAPSTVGTAITVNDPVSSVIAKVYTTNDAYLGVLAVGAKKLKATADFGPAAANKKVSFVIENASGTVKTYVRRANSSGVASFTLGQRGTWTVYATFGDEITDVGTMKK